MKKDAYYFPHFSNARNDSKIIKLRRVLGIEGYGIYFMLLEILREQTDFIYPISGIEDLSYEWHTSKEKIATVINDFGLFEIIDNMFFSSKLVFYLQPYIEKSERARVAAKIRWEKVNANALQMHQIEDAKVLPEHCESECKESKGEESKEKKEYIYNVFYDSELEKNSKSENIEDYKKVVAFIFGNNVSKMKLSGVLKIKKQLSYDEFCSLMKLITLETLKLNLYSVENNKAYQKRETLYMSFLTWAKRNNK